MRVTNQMLVRTALRDLQSSMQTLGIYQEQLSSGKRLHRPSDDPFAVERALSFRSELQALEVCKENIDLSRDWLNAGDITLEKMIDVLTRARSAGVRGADDSVGAAARQALANEVAQLLGSALQAANTSSQGRYLFAGYKINRVPFTGMDASSNPTNDAAQIASVVYNGDNGIIVREVEPGVNLEINLTGNEPWLNPTQDGSVFSVLIDLRDALAADDSGAISAAVSKLDECMDLTGQARATTGAKIQRLDLADEKLDSISLGLEELLSKAEDVDMAEAVVHYSQQETVYQAALKVNARVLPMSLLDYLR
ncbi:MAG: flagellar hook-associated protein FlgL [Anaerolineae bacterium]